MSRLPTLSQSVATHARTQPHKLAVRDSRRSLTYAQWDDRASRLANALLARGLVKGDRVKSWAVYRNFIQCMFENKKGEYTSGYILKKDLQRLPAQKPKAGQ